MAASGQKTGWRDAFLVTWLQVFGIGGAIGLSSIVHNLIFWKGVFLELIAWWDAVVRPLAYRLFSWAFDLFHLELTNFWKDWLAVGTIIGLGFLRHYVVLLYKMNRTNPEDTAPHYDEEKEEWTGYGRGPLIPPFLSRWTRLSPLFFFLISPLLWPLTLLLFIADSLRAVWPPDQFEDKRFVAYSVSTVILPFYYLAIFVAVNEFVLN